MLNIGQVGIDLGELAPGDRFMSNLGFGLQGPWVMDGLKEEPVQKIWCHREGIVESLWFKVQYEKAYTYLGGNSVTIEEW